MNMDLWYKDGFMNKNEIYIKSGTQYKEMTKELLEACDLEVQIPDMDMQIGIKPNLVSPSEASWGATTHPEVVAGICRSGDIIKLPCWKVPGWAIKQQRRMRYVDIGTFRKNIRCLSGICRRRKESRETAGVYS